MTHRITALVVAVVAATVFAASASARMADYEPADEEPSTSIAPAELSARDGSETPLETSGRSDFASEEEYEAETVESDPAITCGIDGQPIESALATSGPATYLASAESSYEYSEGDACSSGAFRPSCRKVAVAVRKRTAFRLSLAFEWVVEKTWCWDYPKVTWTHVRGFPTHLDHYMHYRGVVARFDSYFTWCCFSTRSGHRSYRMGAFENCVPLRGCLGTWYPRVRIEAHGNGTYAVTQKDV